MTVIGLGPMGRALAGAFLKNGHPTTVWNRSAEKADELVAQGAAKADTVADAILASPLVIVCVLDYNVVHSILKHAGDALKGRTLVNLTGGSPSWAREMAEWAAKGDIDYLDGSIIVPTIGESSASILYSGPEDVYQTHQTTLASLGGTSTHLGKDPGLAAAYDTALLDIFWTSMIGYVHALALARAENISVIDLVPYAQGIVGMMPDVMSVFAHQVESGQYPGEESNITSTAAVLENLIHTSKTLNLDVGVLNAAKATVQHAIDLGYGANDFSRLTEVIKKSSM
ncbi:NAD(P)-dependent oxidoreductase [Paenibacillus sp. CECT 9249]|uniref:NAD(P)-dependent oxidoreductase n=1 Tax=unclassified Paenibacillus TaxID=185978 RepID=UPI0025B63631|nr:NAD(P)-binding domain-containing protein [Paenibacillus sp. CECT 9249]